MFFLEKEPKHLRRGGSPPPPLHSRLPLFSEVTGLVIEKAEKGHSLVSLEPDGRHLNAVGGLMGAVYYTMADFAFAVAENCVLDSDTVTVTQTAQINFMRPWRGGRVPAWARWSDPRWLQSHFG